MLYSRKIAGLLGLCVGLTVVFFALLSIRSKHVGIQSPAQGSSGSLAPPNAIEDYRDKQTDVHAYRLGNTLSSRPKRVGGDEIAGEEEEQTLRVVDPYKPDLSDYADKDVDAALDALVDHYLAPWLPVGGREVRRVSQRMLAAMELSYKGGSARIRIQNKRIWYRKIVYWRQTYRTERLAWYLAFLRDLIDVGLIDDGVKVDFVLYLGDGPKVAADTFTQDAGFPLFSLRTSLTHVDIPVPDATAFGSNGNYQWPADAKQTPWAERATRAVFRGRASCLKMQAENWHYCNRVRAAQLAQDHSDLLDIGLIDWNQLFGNARTLLDAPTREEVEGTTGVAAAAPLDYLQQSNFRYILDLDGGLGSSRKPGILSSGSVLVSQQSPWFVHWEPLMRPMREYVSVQRALRDLPAKVQWLRDNDTAALRIMRRGQRFADKFTSLASSRLYMAKLLRRYQTLLDPTSHWSTDEPIAFDYCQRPGIAEVMAGPLACSRGWLEYHGKLPLVVSDDRSHFS